MVSKEKNIPKRRFKEFENAPAWEQRKLGELGNTYTGLSGKTKDDFGHGSAQFVTYMNVYSNSIAKLNDTDNVEIDDHQNKVQYGDVFFTTSSETPEEVGLTSVWLGNDDNTYLNSFCFGYRPKIEIDPYYLAYVLRSNIIRRKMFVLAQGVSRFNISKKKVMELSIPMPSIEEQQHIGSYLMKLDTLITLQQCKIDKLKNLKKSYLSELFPSDGENLSKRRFKEFENAPTWEQRKLGELGNTYTGLSGKTKDDFGHGNAQFVTYMNVYSNSIAKLNDTDNVEIDDHQNKVQYGDVFFTTSSETPEEVGLTSVWLGNDDNTYLNSFCFGYRPKIEIDPYYLAYVLRSNVIRRKMFVLAQGVSRFNISKKKVMELSIPMPSIEEQQHIGSYLMKLDTLITLQQRKLDKLKNLKKAYLSEMFI
ncbi:restriction endonuclease subunit S [Limosilactobacillus equigenerosi]|uniref:restriction endonuclease subunit S n=1 Tax=Limosilactobacillus equigenerosi TaxID=417373 RepID=UPI00077314AA|nr:restriction endonuclease subunit S [Limosilactobacillus equigenerosi]